MMDLRLCPICGGQTFRPYITCSDFAVTRESFHLVQCETCQLVATSPRPSDSEISRYYASENYISHADKPRGVVDRIYWIARKYALAAKHRLLQDYPGKRLLDYGCGTGDFLTYCQSKGYTVTGVEPSSNASTIARQKIHPTHVHDSIETIHHQYDVITLWHVLEHVPDLNQTLSRLKQTLTATGTLIIAVPNLNTWESTLYGKYWAAYDTPRHLWHFTPSTIQKLLQNHGLQQVASKPMKLDAFYISLLSEKYKDHGKLKLSGMINAAKTGLISNIKAKKTGQYSSLIYIFRHA